LSYALRRELARALRSGTESTHTHTHTHAHTHTHTHTLTHHTHTHTHTHTFKHATDTHRNLANGNRYIHLHTQTQQPICTSPVEMHISFKTYVFMRTNIGTSIDEGTGTGNMVANTGFMKRAHVVYRQGI